MLVTNGTIVTLGTENRVIENGALYIRGDRIADIGKTTVLEKKYSRADSERLDAHGKLVMPGSICAHTHFYGAFARGMSLPSGPPPKNFPEILRQLWWKIDRALTLEDLEAIHARKTGALFVAAARGGALAGGAGEAALESLTLFARNLGLAFQITDDLLDLSGDPERMGKDTRRDAHRANFATLLRPASSRRLAEELLDSAVAALALFGKRGAVLADVARLVRDRRS